MKFSKISTPEDFLKQIPHDMAYNVEFRKNLHSLLAKDEGFQKVYCQMCVLKPEIAYDSAFFTYNPRKLPGVRHLPFILRPAQREVVNELKKAIDEGYEAVLDKSRDEGATEIICKLFVLYWLFVPDTAALVGSRNVDLVDKTGDHKALMNKIQYTVESLPLWMRPLNTERNYLHYKNFDINTIIDGESTNESFGAGDRRTMVMVDEVGRILPDKAQNIIDNLSDTADCVIYNSTHFYGPQHAYNRLLTSGKIKTLVLPWERNPEKCAGLYRSPEYNIIEIKDVSYYQKKHPKCFSNIKSMEPFKLSKFEVDLLARGLQPDVCFVADGGDNNDGGWRSPWYDGEEKVRSRRNIAQNIDRNPVGSSDMFFDAPVLRRIGLDCVQKPDFVGEILYEPDSKGKIKKIKFQKDHGRKSFKWWGELPKSRPDQKYSYIVGCDISLGTGASNSVAGIYNADTGEKVGIFASPYVTPDVFADQVIAICLWVGGKLKRPYLIWENNGGQGVNFGNRIRWHGYNFLHIDTKIETKSLKRTNRYGWTSTKKTKEALMVALRIALQEGLKTNAVHNKLIIHDEDTLRELEGYVWTENNKIELMATSEDSSGARAAHGDRVIPDGLYIEALRAYPRLAAKWQVETAMRGKGGITLAYRDEIRKKEKKFQDNDSPWIINHG